ISLAICAHVIAPIAAMERSLLLLSGRRTVGILRCEEGNNFSLTSFRTIRGPRNLRDRCRSDCRADFCLHVAFDGRLRRAAPVFPPNDGNLSAGLTLLVVEHG